MSEPSSTEPAWDLQAARNLYNVNRWGAKYFDINEAGHVVAAPLQEAGSVVVLNDVIEEARARGLRFPLLIRFQDILRHRVEAIQRGLQTASITEFGYQGKYRGVFPIKVNYHCARWWRRSWRRASLTMSGSKWEANPSCSPDWPSKTRKPMQA